MDCLKIRVIYNLELEVFRHVFNHKCFSFGLLKRYYFK